MAAKAVVGRSMVAERLPLAVMDCLAQHSHRSYLTAEAARIEGRHIDPEQMRRIAFHTLGVQISLP